MPKAFFCDQAKAKAFAKHHKTLFCDDDFCKAKRAHAESSSFRERFLLKEERAHARGRARTVERTKRPDNSDSF